MITIDIVDGDGEATRVVCTSRDVTRWERTDKTASLHRLNENMRFADLYVIAWFALLRLGLHAKLGVESAKDLEQRFDLEIIQGEVEDPSLSAV